MMIVKSMNVEIDKIIFVDYKMIVIKDITNQIM